MQLPGQQAVKRGPAHTPRSACVSPPLSVAQPFLLLSAQSIHACPEHSLRSDGEDGIC